MRKTISIGGIGVFPPDREPKVFDYTLNVSENMRRIVRIGDSDHFGLQISFSPQYIKVFPRLCPHRGCSLDKDDCDVKVIICPWHGREFSALCMIENNGKAQVFEGPLHRCTYDGENVEISIRESAAERVRSADGGGIADWTAPWDISRN
jgi:Rieske Fe-S protein